MATSHKLHWNGKDLPAELRDLPPGNYAVESIDEAPALSADDERSIEAGFASLDAGKARTLDEVKQTIDAILRR